MPYNWCWVWTQISSLGSHWKRICRTGCSKRIRFAECDCIVCPSPHRRCQCPLVVIPSVSGSTQFSWFDDQGVQTDSQCASDLIEAWYWQFQHPVHVLVGWDHQKQPGSTAEHGQISAQAFPQWNTYSCSQRSDLSGFCMVGLTDPNLCKTKSNHDSLLQIPGINHFVWSPLPVVAGFTLCMPCTSTISMMTQGRITTLSWTERNNDILSLFHVYNCHNGSHAPFWRLIRL
jgi:hypothetical protein